MKQSILAACTAIALSFALSLIAGRSRDMPPKERTAAPEAAQTPGSRAESKAFNHSPEGDEILLLRGDRLIPMPTEEYIIGVLAAEMPAEFETEALKAQAVAARTYALYCMASDKHPDADVCGDFSCCQAYKDTETLRTVWGGNFEKYHEKLRAAVYATAGEYLSYKGQIVFAAFHSSSAGLTESCGAIWSELPYLVSVESPEDESSVPGYISTLELSALDFRDSLLHARPGADFSGKESQWIGSISYEESGRVESIVIGGESFLATELRSLFALRSTAFTLEYTGDSFLFTVTGFGHGIGMSQYGANVMAQEGADYTAILAHYYPGTALVKGNYPTRS